MYNKAFRQVLLCRGNFQNPNIRATVLVFWEFELRLHLQALLLDVTPVPHKPQVLDA